MEWTKENFLEYRRLKRSGWTHNMLKEHFGDVIYESGLYNKNGRTLPIYDYSAFISEIKISPEEVDYSYVSKPSFYIKGSSDFLISFYSNEIPYILALLPFPLCGQLTYNIIFATRDQWNEYEYNLSRFISKGNITIEEENILCGIISKETNKNDIYSILKKMSWILFDFCCKYLKGNSLSIGETENPIKIKLYRNIIKDSFENIVEKECMLGINRYYVFEIIY